MGYGDRLLLALKMGNERRVRKLINSGHVDVSRIRDDSGASLLCVATRKSDKAMVTLLLEQKNRSNVINGRDGSGRSPLFISVMKGKIEIAQMLLNKGADVNACTVNGASPLHAAATCADVSMCQILLQCGAEVDSQDIAGLTPLFIAVQMSNVQVARCLLFNGADPEACNFFRCNPILVASVMGGSDGPTLLLTLLLLQHRSSTPQDCLPLVYAIQTRNQRLIRVCHDYGYMLNDAELELLQRRFQPECDEYKTVVRPGRVLGLQNWCRRSITESIARRRGVNSDQTLKAMLDELEIPSLLLRFLKYEI